MAETPHFQAPQFLDADRKPLPAQAKAALYEAQLQRMMRQAVETSRRIREFTEDLEAQGFRVEMGRYIVQVFAPDDGTDPRS